MATEPTQRRLAAILSADAVGYSRLMGADDAATVATAKLHRHNLALGMTRTFSRALPPAVAAFERGLSLDPTRMPGPTTRVGPRRRRRSDSHRAISWRS